MAASDLTLRNSSFEMHIASQLTTISPYMLINITDFNSTAQVGHEHTITTMSVLVATVSSLLCVSGFLGNIIIATIIVKRKKMQTSTNWFILNLTICDLVIICTSIPLTMIHHVNANFSFPFGKIGCKYAIMPVLEHFASVSVLTHTAISFAQYTVISRSGFRGFIKSRFVGFVIFLIWCTSFLVLSGSLMGILGYFEFITDEAGRSYCILQWVSTERRYIYRVTVFLLTYIIPMLMTGKSYYTIHTVVRDSFNRVNSLLTEAMLQRRSRKLHQMNTTLTIMYTTFALLTLPFQVFLCLYDFGVLEKSEINFIIFDVFLILFYTQILSNPFVLLYVGDEYRKELRYIRVCCIAVVPHVHRWSTKIEGSFSKFYRRTTTEFMNDINIDDLYDFEKSTPTTPNGDRSRNTQLYKTITNPQQAISK